MTESQKPPAAEHCWDIAVTAAYTANETFDQMQQAKSRYLEFGRVLALVTINGPDGEAPEPNNLKLLEDEFVVLRETFAALSDEVGAAIGPKVFGESHLTGPTTRKFKYTDW